jgi:hypothetical protein
MSSEEKNHSEKLKVNLGPQGFSGEIKEILSVLS